MFLDCFATNAQASPIVNYSFDTIPVLGRVGEGFPGGNTWTIGGNGAGDAYRYLPGQSNTTEIAYDTSSNSLTMNIVGSLNVEGSDIHQANYTFSATFENLTRDIARDGVFGLEENGAVSNVSFEIENFADLTGDGNLDTIEMIGEALFSGDDPSNFWPGVFGDYQNISRNGTLLDEELFEVESSNFVLFDSLGLDSHVLLTSFAFDELFLVNGERRDDLGLYSYLYVNAHGGSISNNSLQADPSSQVPEPTTAALFGLGLLGGAIRKKIKT